MNNEYDNGLYGDHIKYFETETAYLTYKQAGKNVFIPNVAYANTEMIVHYNWDDDIIYDPDEVVLTEDNSTVYTLLYNASIKPTDESKGFTVRDLASITENVIYKMHISDDSDETEFSASIFSRYLLAMGGNYTPRVTKSLDGETIESWTFDEFKYFTGLTRLPRNFFRGCPGLLSITLPHTIETVEYYAFHDCFELSTINLLSHPTFDPASMTFVGTDNNIFANCNIHCSEKIYKHYLNSGNVVDMSTTKVLWSDMSVYTVSEINNNPPSTGYPIAVNIIDDKYVSLKYMSLTTPDSGTVNYSYMYFGSRTSTETGITYHNDISDDYGVYSSVKIQSDKLFVPLPIDSAYITENYKYFNGKELTDIVLSNVSSTDYQTGTITNEHDYPAAECAWRFNPGNTEQGDWYIPEIGELVLIYAYAPIINYVCQVLIDNGYDDYVYSQLGNEPYWSSTFYGSGVVYIMDMLRDYVSRSRKDDVNAVLAMLELATS